MTVEEPELGATIFSRAVAPSNDAKTAGNKRACCLGRAFVVDRDYEDKAPYVVTGTVKEVVFDVKPAHHDAEMALHEHAAIRAVGQGAAG